MFQLLPKYIILYLHKVTPNLNDNFKHNFDVFKIIIVFRPWHFKRICNATNHEHFQYYELNKRYISSWMAVYCFVLGLFIFLLLYLNDGVMYNWLDAFGECALENNIYCSFYTNTLQYVIRLYWVFNRKAKKFIDCRNLI